MSDAENRVCSIRVGTFRIGEVPDSAAYNDIPYCVMLQNRMIVLSASEIEQWPSCWKSLCRKLQHLGLPNRLQAVRNWREGARGPANSKRSAGSVFLIKGRIEEEPQATKREGLYTS